MISHPYLGIVSKGSGFFSPLDVYKMVNFYYEYHLPWSLANTLSEAFEISVVTHLKSGEKEDMEIS